jgi:hypothetical protein
LQVFLHQRTPFTMIVACRRLKYLGSFSFKGAFRRAGMHFTPSFFQQKRGCNAGVGELPLIDVDIGACLGGLVLFFFSTREKRRNRRMGHHASPEDRLPAAMIGGSLFAGTMFW